MVIQNKYFIKKFADRKLYDCQQSKVINFQQLAEIVMENLPVFIVNHEDEDITPMILTDCYSFLLKNTELDKVQSFMLRKSLLKLIKELHNYEEAQS